MNLTREKFDTSHFQDTEYMSAVQKRKVLSDWIRFVSQGFQICHFTKGLYTHLTQHCEFIAHFNRQGFYQDYFQDPEATQRFLDQFDYDKGCVSVEYGMTLWIKGGNDVSAQCYDVNNAMVDSIAGILSELRSKLFEKMLSQAKAQLEAAQEKVARLSITGK